MKNSKFKSSLLTTALISASLFGSKPNPGKLQLTQEKQQEILHTSTEEDLLPPRLKNFLIDIFNCSPEIKKIEETYFHNYIEWSKGRDKYQQKIIKTGCGNYSFKVSKNFIKEDFFKQAINQYLENAENFFKKEAQSFLSNLGFERDQSWILVIVKPFLCYSFFDLIGFVNKLDMFEIFQEEALYDINNRKELFIIELCLLLANERFYRNNDNQTEMFREMLIYFSNKYADIYNMQDLKECLTKYSKARKAIIQQDKIVKELTNEIEKRGDLQRKLEEINNEVLLLATKEGKEQEKSILIKKYDDLCTEINNSAQKYQELMLVHSKEKLVENVKTTIHESRKAAENLITEIVEQLSPKEHTSKEYKKQKQPKQASLYGRKAAPATQAISTRTSQKQMKQAPKPKTLEDLDAKFGEDLEKAFDELELIIIDFESEEDWNDFVEEYNVQISEIAYRHGSHESQEIFFIFEGQRTKGQLLTHHVHGKDTPKEISRQVKVMRRIQK